MAEVLLFHHALGLTDGCRAFADRLRREGHIVHLPDLYGGRTFGRLEDGVAHAEAVGFATILERGSAAAERLLEALVFAGLSLGVMPAQMLAQTRPGARGALLLHSCVPAGEFGPWPAGVALQIHTRDADPWGDADVARALAASVPGAELFLYPGDRHLFTDASLPDHEEEAAALVMQRVLAFLARHG